MKNLTGIFVFDEFRFDADRFALYHQNELVKSGDRKTMQVLAVLLTNPNRLTVHEEIIEYVWQDNLHGANSARVNQYIKRLRKIFGELAPDKQYIETVKGLGYKFAGDVSFEEPEMFSSDEQKTEANLEIEEKEHLPDLPESVQISDKKETPQPGFGKFLAVFSALALISAIVFSAWIWFGQKNDDEEIRRVVKDSQLYESLVLYKNPSAFNEENLDKYWTKESDVSLNADRTRVRKGVRNLIKEGKYYGDETKCEQFEFQSIEINKEKDFAAVRTLEKWFAAVYFNDGILEKNKTIGPYFVDYILRKVDGKWLIEKSNTARVSRPTPRLTEMNAVTEIKGGQQFFVKITGQDFEPETIFLEITGEGCPESRQCKVPNSALREHSKMSETVLENVPLTLATGDFRITARNDNSPASNQLDLKVP